MLALVAVTTRRVASIALFAAVLFSFSVSAAHASGLGSEPDLVAILDSGTSPICADSTASTVHDTPSAIDLGALCGDPGGALTYVVDQSPSHGIATVSGAIVTDTPAAGFVGTDTFTYHATDGVDPPSASQTITLTVTDQAPVCSGQSVNAVQGQPKVVLLSCTDADGDALTYSIVSGPGQGSVGAPAGNAVTYTASPGYAGGPDSFTFKASDGAQSSTTATVTIVVNHAPTCSAASASTLHDRAVGLAMSCSDADGDALSYSVVSGPSHGVVSIAAPTATYTPSAGFAGSDSFTFHATDSHGISSTPATATITVAANRAPVCTGIDSAHAVPAVQDNAVDLTLTCSDADGDPMTFSIVNGPQHGTLGSALTGTGNTRHVTYTASASYVGGPDSITFKASDGITDSATVTVSIAVDTPPTCTSVATSTIHDHAKTVALGCSDADAGDTLTYHITQPAHGTWTRTGGSVTYTPAVHYTGPDSFSYYVTDADGVDSPTQTASITVTDVKPTCTTPATVNAVQGQPKAIALSCADTDADPVVLSVVGAPSNGTLGAISTSSVTYTASATYPGGPDSFTFKANDGVQDSATVTVTIAVNHIPVCTDVHLTTHQNQAVSVSPACSDLDGSADTLTYSVDSQPQHMQGAVTLPGTYRPLDGFTGTDTFTYHATDSHGIASATKTVTIAVDDRPPVCQATPTTVGAVQGQPVIIDLGRYCSDADGDTLSYSASAPTHGSVHVAGSIVTYTAAAEYGGGPDSFTFVANDGAQDSATRTVTIAVDHPPACTAATASAQPAQAVTIPLSCTDVDGDPITYAITGQPQGGTVSIDTAGTATYTPQAGFGGTDSFTYLATDVHGVSSPGAGVSVVVPAASPPSQGAAGGGTGSGTGAGTGTHPNLHPVVLTAGGQRLAAVRTTRALRITVDGPGGSATLAAKSVRHGTSTTLARRVVHLAPGSHTVTLRISRTAVMTMLTGRSSVSLTVTLALGKTTRTLHLTLS